MFSPLQRVNLHEIVMCKPSSGVMQTVIRGSSKQLQLLMLTEIANNWNYLQAINSKQPAMGQHRFCCGTFRTARNLCISGCFGDALHQDFLSAFSFLSYIEKSRENAAIAWQCFPDVNHKIILYDFGMQIGWNFLWIHGILSLIIGCSNFSPR